MERAETEHHYRVIQKSVYNGKIRNALERVKLLTRQVSLPDSFYTLQSLEENYFNLVKYAVEGYDDPKRNEILQSISASILSLADEVYDTIMLRFQPGRRSEKVRLAAAFGTDPQVIAGRAEEFLVNRQLRHLIEESEIGPGDITAMVTMDDLFKLVWLTDKAQDYHLSLLRKVKSSHEIPWTEKCLVVSALTLSVLSHFDIQKIHLLIEFVEAREPQVYQRALVGLILALIIHDKRLGYYPELEERLGPLEGDPQMRSEAELIILQLLTARETERITQEFEKEVLPEMKKMMPRIEDKLQLGDPGEESGMDDKNPVWKEMMDEVPGLYEKIEKFSKMQMEGADVFMGTFSMLKRFDFFNSMSNWFLPFYKENPSLGSSTPSPESYQERLFEGLEKAFYICNSDKYSFAFNFMGIPAPQKSMIVTYFEAELNQMKEMATEEQLLDQSLFSNAVMVQYIQDLYRFYKLYPGRSEFQDIFQVPLDFGTLQFFPRFFDQRAFTEKIAAFYFEKDHWAEAIPLYTYLCELPEPRADIFQKAAYACQMAGKYREAIALYKKAELFDTDQQWILTKLAWCHMKLEEYDQAIKYFELAADRNPSDLKLKSQVAQCHLSRQDYESALKIYSGLRFYTPSSLKVLRPIAFCLFATGKLQASEETYREILGAEGKKTLYDYMNAGHVKLCLKKTKEAGELYKLSLIGMDAPWTSFFEAFDEDVPMLVRNGIPAREIPLLRDYLMYEFESR
jgi:tetratricopeptide (TPR) repeat protein